MGDIKAPGPPRVKLFSDACLFAVLVWMVIPEVWTKPVTLGSVPLHFVFAQLLWISLTLEGLLQKRRSSGLFWLLLAATGYATARAFFVADRNHWDLKYFVSDLWTVQVFLLAFLWSRRRSISEIEAVCRVTAAVVIPIVALTIAGLYLDVIKPADQEYSDRLYTSSLWAGGSIAQFLWAILFACGSTAERGPAPGGLWRAYLRMCVQLLVPAALLVAVFTATRSLLIVTLIMYFAARLSEPMRNTQRSIATVSVLIIFLSLGLGLSSVTRMKGYSVLDRFEQADELQSGRGVELQSLFEQLGDDYVSGWGFGSLFYSPIKYQNRLFETAPHVGIVTFLLKGGLIMGVIFVFVPVAMCVRSLWTKAPVARAATGCVLVYLTTACMSGGWYPYQMMMFGVGVGMVSLQQRRSALGGRPA
jgi:hypothetical protein